MCLLRVRVRCLTTTVQFCDAALYNVMLWKSYRIHFMHISNRVSGAL